MLHCLFWNRKGGRNTNWYQLFYSFKLHASQSFLKVCYVTLLICILHCPTWDYFPWTISKVWADLLMFAQGRPKGKKNKDFWETVWIAYTVKDHSQNFLACSCVCYWSVQTATQKECDYHCKQTYNIFTCSASTNNSQILECFGVVVF